MLSAILMSCILGTSATQTSTFPDTHSRAITPPLSCSLGGGNRESESVLRKYRGPAGTRPQHNKTKQHPLCFFSESARRAPKGWAPLLRPRPASGTTRATRDGEPQHEDRAGCYFPGLAVEDGSIGSATSGPSAVGAGAAAVSPSGGGGGGGGCCCSWSSVSAAAAAEEAGKRSCFSRRPHRATVCTSTSRRRG